MFGTAWFLKTSWEKNKGFTPIYKALARKHRSLYLCAMSNLYRFIESLPVMERGRDYVRKTASARDFVACLQVPENYERDMAFVPDVPVELYLSRLDACQNLYAIS